MNLFTILLAPTPQGTFAIGEIVLFSVIAGLLAGAVLAAWPCARLPARLVIAGLSTTIGMMVWYLTLNATQAGRLFDVDALIVRVSWADAGSGIFAFVVCALALGLGRDRQEDARRVVGAAAIAGIVALVLDLFVL
jgi:hypothetical protein